MGYPDALRDEVEAYLEGLSFAPPGATDGLQEAMRYSLLAGGKRIRPVLALATARAVGLPHEAVLPYAAALELVHTYSLIHDDLPAMDDDDLRRGRPTCHVKYGEDVAILAGDALYAEAFHLLLRSTTAVGAMDPADVIAAAAELAAATGVDGMVGGQYIDVAGTATTAQELRALHALKTGRLIGASVVGVLLLGGIKEPATMAYRQYATEIGVLFQIVDDILDVTGTDADLGKPQGSDERHGKRTYVSEFGLDGARELAARCHQDARTTLATAAAAHDGRADELEQITDFILTRTA
ncbi:polyprenyl synthetase family protein [Paraconexibacter algicola]|uniref:Polyprenyl synthetase family protein n=1 Tax=Paraconexibacter algicola TaxID=2133960 RepID=A0A2T4UC48_9ACTN|nr:farnesyl diphosphate synthase [Paraconexibacter algicola]PTL54772.1 polyprenyl synthetase family protein [Paraconexibacter algicola]